VTPTPATNLREAIRPSDCKSDVIKHASEATNWSVTSASHHFWIRGSIGEQPVVCGKAEGALRLAKRAVNIWETIWQGLGSPLPSDPPSYRSVAQSSERAAWDREVAGENPAVPTNFNLLPWSNTSGIRLLSRNDAGENPAGSAIARWCQSSTAVC
jgi:hypothetical protein